MPTVLQDGPYDFVFFSSDEPEPPHFHVKRDRLLAKFWLDPIEFAKSRGFKQHELNKIERLVTKYHRVLGDGYAIEWPDLDEHIGIEGLLAGRRSRESAKSLARWRALRQKAA